MRPRFSALTQVLAGGFILAGIAEALMALRTTQEAAVPGVGNQITIFVLAVGLVATGFAMWAEYVWAWWVGLTVTVFTVFTSVTLARDVSWIPWTAFLIVFGISAAQGWRDGVRESHEAH